jgi:nitroreductase
LQFENGILKVDYKYCSTCTQCISVCPKQAITWDNVKPEKFDKSLYPDSAHFAELLMQRRTIRDYTNQKIDRLLLEEIAGFAIYAPTNNFNLRTIIIDEDQLINRIDSLIYQFSANLYNWLYRPWIIQLLIKIFSPGMEFEYLKAKPKLENAKKRNRSFKSKPAAIILIIGDKKVPLTLESAQYALYNIDLYAQTKGIACRNLVGTQMVMNKSNYLRELLGLSKNENIFGAITMGYSAINFRNKVMGKNINIQWNGIIK